MSRRRGKVRAGTEATTRPGGSEVPAAPDGPPVQRNPPPSRKRAAWFAVAGIAVLAVVAAALAWPRRHVGAAAGANAAAHVDGAARVDGAAQSGVPAPAAQFDMVKTLAAIAANEDAWDNPWDAQPKKIADLQAALSGQRDPIKRLITQRELAQQYVNGGTSEPAIDLLKKLLVEYHGVLPVRDVEVLKADLAFAYFRLGELQNCTWNHNSSSCIFPIRGGGVHQEQLGAREAAKRYRELLSDPAIVPENALLYRWLLNISYMVLGQYPQGVPKRWLIAPATFKSDFDIGLFHDVALSRGVNAFGRAGGAILEDFDNDGHLDLMVSHMGIEEQVEYFHNKGDGTFARKTDEAGLKGITGGLNMVQGDYNNDGCIDVFIPRGAWLHDKGRQPSSLLRNNCDGTFTDVTAQAGVLNNLPTQTAVWADFNNDGLLDLFVGNEIVRDKVSWPADTPNFRLYINNGDGTFTDVGADTGIKLDGMVKGAAADDYDNDGWQDLYVSVMGKPNHLFRNLGAPGKTPKFVDVTAQAGVGEPNMSFTCWFFDYNNDGWPDIFVSGYWATVPNIVREYLGEKDQAQGDRPRLYRNNKDGTFTDASREAHLDRLLLTMGANFGDLDNDGWLDFYLGTGAAPLNNIVPHQMFRNHQGEYFQNVTTAGGFGHLQKGHAVAFGDVDNDGSQDVFENIGGAFTSDKFWSALYKNPGNHNHWVKLRLVGVKANRFAIGARIRVQTTEAGKAREIWRSVNSGGSFGASSVRPHIGIGRADVIDALEIRWPGSGLVQHFAGPIAADRVYEIREGGKDLKVADVGDGSAAAPTRPKSN